MRNNFYLDIIKKLISHLVIFLTKKYLNYCMQKEIRFNEKK